MGISEMESKILTQALTSNIIEAGDYTVVERANIEKILEEQMFQHSGCTDSECAVEIGQLLNADFTVIGTAGKFGSTYTIQTRIINVETGEAVKSADFTHKGEIDELLNTGIENIIQELLDMDKKPINVIPTVSNVGFLKVSVYPKLAHIYVDDSLKSNYTELTTGKHTLKVSYPGYDDYTNEIEIKLDETTELGIMLKDKNKPAADYKKPASNNKKQQPPQADPNKVYNIEIGDSFTMGPKNAKVTIIEWMDFQ